MYPSGVTKVLDFNLRKMPLLPVFLVGHSGLGKTMSAKDAAKRNNAIYVRLNATGMEPPDLTGMPKISTDGFTTFAPLQMLRELSSDKLAILNFDEINRVPTETRHVLMQGLDERMFGEFKLGPNVLIVLTANPDDPGYQVDDLDTAFLRRCLVLTYEFHFDSFQDWALNQYRSPVKGCEEKPLSPRVLSAMARNKQAFWRDIRNKEKFAQAPTPAGTVRCSELEHSGIFGEFELDEVIQIFAGIVGGQLATSIAKDMNDEKLKDLKKKIDNLQPIGEIRHDVQIDLLYYVWEDYGSQPAKSADKIHHLFMSLHNDIKLIMVKLCAKFFSNAKTRKAFEPMKADWKKLMSEMMLKSKGVDEDEIRSLLNSL